MRAILKRYWMERTPRERWVLGAGTVLLAAAIVYAYLWLPIARERERLMADLPKLRMQAQQMRAEALLIEDLRRIAGTAPTDLNAVLMSAMAFQGGSRMSPQMSAEANGRVRVTFASVSAKAWQAWIAALSAERGIRVEAAQIDPLEPPDMIKASTIFSSGS